ncbi:hypothetical protein [Acetobacter sp.]|uniref:hypothetical protein n=1 Tax=Acetobacter sp. TaxID=440 RepID=UPI0039EC8161
MARTREEQIVQLKNCVLDWQPELSPSARQALAAVAKAYVEEAEQRGYERARDEILKGHSWFYMVDDPESGYADMADMLCETKPFEIVETVEAGDIRTFFAFQDEDGEIHEFPTRAEAEQAATTAAAMKEAGL